MDGWHYIRVPGPSTRCHLNVPIPNHILSHNTDAPEGCQSANKRQIGGKKESSQVQQNFRHPIHSRASLGYYRLWLKQQAAVLRSESPRAGETMPTV